VKADSKFEILIDDHKKRVEKELFQTGSDDNKYDELHRFCGTARRSAQGVSCYESP
jgi:hypothetical protein